MSTELRWLLWCAAPLGIGITIAHAGSCPALGAQVSGLAFEASGLLMVWRGLDEIARTLGLKTTWQRLRDWWFAWLVPEDAPTGSLPHRLYQRWCSFFGVKSKPEVLQMGEPPTIRYEALQPTFIETLAPGASTDARLGEVRAIVARLDKELQATRAEIDSLTNEVAAQGKQGREAVSAVRQESAQKLAGVAGDRIHDEAFGLLLVFVGAVFTTFAGKIATFWPFAL